MKKFLTKSILFSAVFFGIGVIALLIVKASLLTANTGDKLTSAKRNDVINKVNSLETTLTALSSVPAGQVSAFNLSSCPTGRIPANGSNSTPDLRGEFIRGLDGGRGVDSGRTLGSAQKGTPVITDNGPDASDRGIEGIESIDGNATRSTLSDNPDSYSPNWFRRGASTRNYITDNLSNSSEFRVSRPRNVALLYCVKQ